MKNWNTIQEWLKDWPETWYRWWAPLNWKFRYLPLIGVLIFWMMNLGYGGFRQDHFNMGALILVLYYSGPKLRPFLKFIFPILLTGMIYDSMRIWGDWVRGRIRVEEPYLFDLRFFGIESNGKILTPNEWFQLHTHVILDFFTGLAYIIFVPVYAAHGAYIRFWLTRKGTPTLSAHEVELKTRRLMWCFFWVNMLGYSTYYWFPAAPPWYVSIYGLGPANMSAIPNAAGCVRFDQIFGTHIFDGWYGRSHDVFGAIPSLHVAYPLLSVLFAFEIGATRLFAVMFYALMCFSAVYLNHHYILDIIWGSVYAILVFILVRKLNIQSDRPRPYVQSKP